MTQTNNNEGNELKMRHYYSINSILWDQSYEVFELD